MADALDPAAPLCSCGIRGCTRRHQAVFVDPTPTWRRLRPARKQRTR